MFTVQLIINNPIKNVFSWYFPRVRTPPFQFSLWTADTAASYRNASPEKENGPSIKYIDKKKLTKKIITS